MNYSKSDKKKAVEAFVKYEVSENYSAEFKVSEYSNDFLVEFSRDDFNDVYIRVVSIDEKEPEFSEFQVCVYEDHYEAFNAYGRNCKEFWKALLWK